MDEARLEELRAELADALRAANQTERMLEVAAVVARAVDDLGVHPVVVGGLAVATWLPDTYLTSDIDVVMPHLPGIDERLGDLGFVREGRVWVIPGRDIVFEAPGSVLEPDEEFAEIELASGRTVRVLRPEDVLIYRLHEFVGGGHADSFQQVLWLMRAAELDRSRLVERLKQEGLTEAFAQVEKLAERMRRTEQAPASWELHDLARQLRRRGLR